MRTRIILISLAALAAAAVIAVAAGRPGEGSDGRTRVAAAFYPLAYAAEEIGKHGVTVENLTPPGAEPHDLEVSPGNVQALERADLVLLLGHGFQPSLERAAGSGPKVLRLLDTPGLQRFPDGDPHVWLDPLRYARIAERIAETLEDAGAGRSFAARLRSLDQELHRGLARCARRQIVTSHEAFRYLAERFGLRQVAISGLSPEAEPSPARLRRVIETIRRTGATTLFFETLVSHRLAQTVARETGARTAVLNPIEGLTDDERSSGKDYFALMRENLTSLRKGLGCR
jgi:zinc transport system substrate-binding protein